MSANGRPAWRLETDIGAIGLVDVPAYEGAAPDGRHVEDFTAGYRPSSAHLLTLDGEPIALFVGSGGATAVHPHSAVHVRGLLYVAVCDRVVCVRPKPYERRWTVVADPATCFGVHYDAAHDALISHGELQIARLDDAGRIVWSASGADIFTGAFRLAADAVEATDFDGRIHRFDYADGSPVGR